MNKIIYLGKKSLNLYVPENLIPKNFKKLGYEVYRPVCVETTFEKLKNDILDNQDADFLFVYGRGLFPVLTSIIKEVKIPKIIWMPSIITDSPGAQSIVKNDLPYFDIVYTCIPSEKGLYKKLGVDSRTLFAATDGDYYKSLDINRDINIGFYGNVNYDNRKKLIEYINQKYDLCAIFSGDKYIELINRTKINVNMGLFSFGIPNRVFDTLSCGQFLISPEYIGIDSIFKNKKHLVYFDKNNLYDILDYYLENADERDKIANEGQKEVLEKHTFIHRIKEIIKDVAIL